MSRRKEHKILYMWAYLYSFMMAEKAEMTALAGEG